MSERLPDRQEADLMVLAAEELVAKARATARSLGIVEEASALAILETAYAKAVADKIGVEADDNRLFHYIGVASLQVTRSITMQLDVLKAQAALKRARQGLQ